MFFHDYLNTLLRNTLHTLVQDEIFKKEILSNFKFSIEIPTLQEHGDVSSNVAMVYSKKTDLNLIDLAERIKKELLNDIYIREIKIVKPGFVNIFFKTFFWQEQLKKILNNENFYTMPSLKKKINIEFVSANPTGLLHIGHARGAVFGDAIANILIELGHDVTKEYYINDAGNQIKLLVKTINFHIENIHNNSNKELPESFYPGNYLKEISQIIFKNFNKILTYNEDKKNETIRLESIRIILQDIKSDLLSLGIKHNIYTSEKEITSTKKVNQVISFLESKELAYEGFQEPPKGIDVKKWKQKKQLLFRSKSINDDSDRALIKPDGELTYFMSDIIYHEKKINKKYDLLLNVWGVDHGGYVARLKNALSAIYGEGFNLEIKLTALVNLIKNNKSIKMSKRKGTYITMREVINEVGKDALRFMMVSRSSEKVIDFNFDIIKSKTKENPVFYVQYAHARCSSIQNLSKELFNLKLEKINIDYSLLTLKEEIILIKNLANFNRIIVMAAMNFEPHRLCNYLYDLSKNFHNYWSIGRSNIDNRILIKEKENISLARLSLISAVKKIISKGLSVLNISAPESM